MSDHGTDCYCDGCAIKQLRAELADMQHQRDICQHDLHKLRAQLQAVAGLPAKWNGIADDPYRKSHGDEWDAGLGRGHFHCARELTAALETPPRGIVDDSFIPSLHMPPLATETPAPTALETPPGESSGLMPDPMIDPGGYELCIKEDYAKNRPPPPSGEAVCPECKGYLHPRSCPACRGTGRTPAGTSPAPMGAERQGPVIVNYGGGLTGPREDWCEICGWFGYGGSCPRCNGDRGLQRLVRMRDLHAVEDERNELRQKLAAEQQARQAAEGILRGAKIQLAGEEQARAKAESELAVERSRYACRHPEVCWNPNHPEYEEDK